MRVLAVSGDVGGARAVKAVLQRWADTDKKYDFSITDYRFLSEESPASWQRVALGSNWQDELATEFHRGRFNLVLFSTSVTDALPLKVVRLARECKVPVLCLLDNWMNYAQRLAIDGQPVFWPDLYLVMDQIAYENACADGVPKDILRVVGQPALASLAAEHAAFKQMTRAQILAKYKISEAKKVLVFISEPVAQDQGTDTRNPEYRGYTEKEVLKELCGRLNAYAKDYQLVIVPHPRENKAGLDIVWQQHREDLEGGVYQFERGREAVLLADGVLGMVSILLYEAWLINKPVISLQPGLLKKELESIFLREGVFAVKDLSSWDKLMPQFLAAVDHKNNMQGVRQELKEHLNAADKIINVMGGVR